VETDRRLWYGNTRGFEARKALYITVQSIDLLSEISWYLKIFCKEPALSVSHPNNLPTPPPTTS